MQLKCVDLSSASSVAIFPKKKLDANNDAADANVKSWQLTKAGCTNKDQAMDAKNGYVQIELHFTQQ